MLTVVLAACGSATEKKQASAPPKARTQAAKAPARTASGCRVVARPGAKRVKALRPPRARLDPGKTWTATLKTSCGTIVIRLDVKGSPKTSASFASLARKGFYDGLSFQRVVQGFVVQGGDPRGDGTGGPGYQTVEPPPRSVHYTRGTVAMAKAGPEARGTAGSQFFIVTAKDATVSAGLTPDYAVLGRVVKGIGVATRIGSIPTNPAGDGVPEDPVVIDSARISSR